MSKFFTIKDFINFLQQFPEDAAVALDNNPMGWVNGAQAYEDEMFYYDRNKSNKLYMLFEENPTEIKHGKNRKSQKVVKITGWYNK